MRNTFTTLTLFVTLFLSSAADAQNIIRFVVFPDTQNNADLFPEVLNSQFDWVAENSSRFNFVLHVGDVVESSSNTTQWALAKTNFDKLTAKSLPYVFCIGNHDVNISKNTDIGATCDKRVTTACNNAFPASSFAGLAGVYQAGKIDNSYHIFRAAGKDLLVMSLEICPNDLIVAWANTIIANNPDKLVIILTHNYMAYGSVAEECTQDMIMNTINWRSFAPAPYDDLANNPSHPESVINTGEMLWNKLVRKHKNIFATFSGHVLGTGTAKLVNYGDNGNKIYNMLQNYQNQVNILTDGGKNGYLRIVEINLDEKTMQVLTYSPYLKQYFPTNIKQNYMFGGVNLDEGYR